ncbi:MAG TPA: response regulator [Bryobacteraceae bacterium]|nr:response regulator [Bryobacteraceae bacterium]
MAVILVVEDSDSVTALEIALASCLEGMKTLVLPDGREALKLLDRDTLEIAAVITDIHLPFVDGFELISAIRSHPRYARLPVVAVSGDNAAETSRRIERLGADAFFAKPFSPIEVCKTVRKLLYAP